MKVLFLPAYYYPETAASSYLGDNIRETLCTSNTFIELYAPTPCRGISPEIRKEYCSNEHGVERMYDGYMTIHRFSLYAEGKNPILRALRYALCWIKQFNRGLLAKDIDVIYLASTPPIQGMIGAFLKKIKHIPFVYNLQDIFPDSLVGTGLARKGGLLWKIGRVIENFTYRHADKIIVISNDFKRNIMAKGVPESKIEVIYNWVDEQAVVNIDREDNKLFDKYGLDRSKFYITYCGNIGLTQNLEMLVEVADELSGNKDIHFVLVGNGAYWNTLVEKLKEKRSISNFKVDDGTEALTFGNITLLPFQPYDDISHVFSLGDVSIIISKPGVGANSVPSKTWSIMSASRPVIANFDENEIKEILEGLEKSEERLEMSEENAMSGLRLGGPCGIFTKAGDKEAFKNAILKFYNDRELCRTYGENGRQFILNNLTKEVGTSKYVEVIKGVVEKNQ